MQIADLKNQKIFCCWKKLSKDGRTVKMPIDCNTGRGAKSNDSTTWVTYQQAYNCLQAHQDLNGIGIMFAPISSTYLCGIDIDGHKDGTNPIADDVLQMFARTYAETSPSGTGYHILFTINQETWAKLQNQKPKNKNDDFELECYISGLTNRYFTFSENPVNTAEIADCSDLIFPFLKKYGFLKEQKEQEPPQQTVFAIDNTDINNAAAIPEHTAQWATQRLAKAKQSRYTQAGQTNTKGKIFKELYENGNYAILTTDQSRCRYYLCSELAYYLDKDTYWVSEMYRRSAIYNEDKAQREKCVHNAIANCKQTYGRKVTPTTPTEPQQTQQNNAFKSLQSQYDKDNTGKLTVGNLKAFLKDNAITVKLNELTHCIELQGTFNTTDGDMQDLTKCKLTDSVELFEDKLDLAGCTSAKILAKLEVIANKNPYNPVLDIIMQTQWDSVDRLPSLYKMLCIKDDDTLSKTLIHKWLMQCIAGLYNGKNGCCFSLDAVLVLQGKQGKGKTTFFNALSMANIYQNQHFFAEGKSINVENKDSVMTALASWITELGEIESTFKREISSLKAFISNSVDTIRKPYGKEFDTYPRITSFCGTCNSDEFLADTTGNRRFWTITLPEDFEITQKQLADFDFPQLWKQIWVEMQHLIFSSEDIADEYIDTDNLALYPYQLASVFRLTSPEKEELEKRNGGNVKKLKAEEEILDILYYLRNQLDTSKYKVDYMYMTASQFKQEHLDELKNYSSSDIGKALQKIGFEQLKKRINGVPAKAYCLPHVVAIQQQQTQWSGGWQVSSNR